MKTRRRSLTAVFALPLLVSILALVGLVGALLEDGPWDGLGALLLAVSIGAIGWARVRAGRP